MIAASSDRRKRKTGRAPAAKTSLRTEAIEAQKSRDLSVDKPTAQDGLVASKVVSSLRSWVSGVQLNPICAILDSHRFCAAEEYDMVHIDKILNLPG